ncbi:MAG: DUF3857 domain-containing protein, partial [Mesorhizobium sp.]|nr:DUF3857 domain-containing protein [Mesorhizobium sp.]
MLGTMLLAWVLAAPAKAGDRIERKPADGWVEILDIPEPDSAHADRIQDGKSYLLSDFQVRPVEGGWEMYDRLAYQLVDRTGLDEGARISFEFDPETETVALNRLQIVRDGVPIDRLANARIEIARREEDAERGIFDGRLTAYINLEDVRVGDIIDSARTR